MQTGRKIILFGFLSAFLGGLMGCTTGDFSAPINSIENFGDASTSSQQDSGSEAVTSEPVDDEDQEMHKAEVTAQKSTSSSPQLVVQRQWNYQKPESTPPKATPPQFQVESTSVAKTSVHSIVNGTVISDDAGVISLQAKSGESVHSVAKGSVIYTGPSVQGNGKMVIVKNADGTLFAYSHLGTLSVSEGHTVDTSEILGTVSDEPLVFQVRQASGVVDAKKYL